MAGEIRSLLRPARGSWHLPVWRNRPARKIRRPLPQPRGKARFEISRNSASPFGS